MQGAAACGDFQLVLICLESTKNWYFAILNWDNLVSLRYLVNVVVFYLNYFWYKELVIIIVGIVSKCCKSHSKGWG